MILQQLESPPKFLFIVPCPSRTINGNCQIAPDHISFIYMFIKVQVYLQAVLKLIITKVIDRSKNFQFVLSVDR